MDEIGRKRFERKLGEKLHPTQVSATLIGAGLFLVAYELLKAEVIGKIREFFISGVDAKGFTYSGRYATEVLRLDRDRFKASCLWLSRQGVFTDSDVDTAAEIREHRHAIAHEMSKFLIDPDASVDVRLLSEARRLITLLGRFWGRIAIAGDEQFDGQEIPDEEIESGSMLLMAHILSIVGTNDT